MRTTLVLPDDLYREVKATAAVQGRTVTSVVEESLREFLATHNAPAPLSPLPVSDVPWGLSEEFLATGIDFNDSSAVLDWLDQVEGRYP